MKNLLSLNTTHLSKMAQVALRRIGDDFPEVVTYGRFATFAAVGGFSDAVLPQSLRDCLTYAAGVSADWIIFTSDGATAQDLAVYA